MTVSADPSGPRTLDPRSPWILLGAAFLARLVAATASPLVNADALYYLETAEAFGEGRWSEGLRLWSLHPLYSVLVAAVRLVVADPWVAGAAVSIVAGTLSLLPLHALAREGWGRSVAWCVGFLYAFHPVFTELHGKVLSEGLYHLLAFGATYALGRGLRDSSWRWGALSGGLAGLAYLARVEGLILGAGLFLLGLAVPLLRRSRPSWKLVATWALAAALAASPFLLWLRGDTGSWALSPRDSYQRAVTAASGGTVRPRAEGRGAVALHVGKKLAQDLSPALWVLGAAGLVMLRPAGSGGAVGLLAGSLAGVQVSLVLAYGLLTVRLPSDRYLTFSAGLLSLWAGWGLYRILGRLAPLRGGPVLASALLLVVAAALVGRHVDYARGEDFSARAAADWLRAEAGEGKAVLASMDGMAFHARARLIRVRTAKAILEAVESGRAEYLMYLERDLPRLGDEAWGRIQARPGARFLRRFGEGRAAVVVYALNAAH